MWTAAFYLASHSGDWILQKIHNDDVVVLPLSPWERHVFESLNIPQNTPAKSAWAEATSFVS